MKRSIHKINDNHVAVIEMRDNYIYLWISEIRNYFFGYIPVEVRLSDVKLFTLCIMDQKDEGYPCTTYTTTSINGRIMNLSNHRRNIDTFDILNEIDVLYSGFLESKNKKELFDQKLLEIGSRLP